MARPNANDLLAFLAVARARSFTKAAAQLGVSPSALSHTIRGLEERLGLRLLTRTTRRVEPTEVGGRLLRAVGPRFDEIEAEVTALSELRDKPAGTIRITAGEHPADTILWPILATFLPHYPDIKMEIVIDYGLTDIVAGHYDAGVRLGEQVAKDLVVRRPASRSSPARERAHLPGTLDDVGDASKWMRSGALHSRKDDSAAGNGRWIEPINTAAPRGLRD